MMSLGFRFPSGGWIGGAVGGRWLDRPGKLGGAPVEIHLRDIIFPYINHFVDRMAEIQSLQYLYSRHASPLAVVYGMR